MYKSYYILGLFIYYRGSNVLVLLCLCLSKRLEFESPSRQSYDFNFIYEEKLLSCPRPSPSPVPSPPVIPQHASQPARAATVDSTTTPSPNPSSLSPSLSDPLSPSLSISLSVSLTLLCAKPLAAVNGHNEATPRASHHTSVADYPLFSLRPPLRPNPTPSLFLSFFLACESKKPYSLVDNRPWLRDLGSRRAQLWQLMVTKSRLSPFANTKARRDRKEEQDSCCRPNTSKSDKLKKWFSLIDAVMLSHKRVLLPVKQLRESSLVSNELHRTLYGFILFEVSWNNVRASTT
ncbi:hypothetical protein I3843_16G089700 [Carya illinoinensis]|nr:hypothetical protein I3843_16G089700 [Carya illinoinensis]